MVLKTHQLTPSDTASASGSSSTSNKAPLPTATTLGKGSASVKGDKGKVKADDHIPSDLSLGLGDVFAEGTPPAAGSH